MTAKFDGGVRQRFAAGVKYATADVTDHACCEVGTHDGAVVRADFTASVVGHIRGRVLDAGGEPLAYATVELRSHGHAIGSLLADEDGAYDFALTASGSFELLAIR